MMAVLIVAVLTIALLAFVIYFLRSSKEMPKNRRELLIEAKFQVYGVTGFFEDVFMRWRNKFELVKRPNKVAVMTGGNRGIGIYVVEKLLKSEMTVMLGVRNPEGSKTSVEDALGLELTNGKVFYEKCDTGDMESVREFAKKVQQKFPAVHVLINNAGVMCTPYKETKDGFESQMAINYLGHFLLTHLLMPQLIAGSKDNDGENVRIVNVSSCVHKAADIDYDDFHLKKFYYPADAYNKSKLAQILFTKSIENLCYNRKLHIQVHSVHPGIVNTDLFQNSSSDYFPWVRKFFYKTPEEGARTIVFAATSPKVEGQGGTYFSNCTKWWHHEAAEDVKKCRKLFDFSCELLNVDEFGIEG